MRKEAPLSSAERLMEETKQVAANARDANTQPLTSPLRPVDNSNSSQDQGQKVITIRGKEYILFKGRILEDQEASKIYNNYLEMMSAKK